MPEFLLAPKHNSQAPQLVAPQGKPEQLFKTTQVVHEKAVYSSTMETGPWLESSPGIASAGVVGVIMDDTLGAAAMINRPSNMWAVTTELSLNFIHPLPTDGQFVTAVGEHLGNDEQGCISQGFLRNASGRLLVQGTTRLKLSHGVPESVVTQRAAPPLQAEKRSIAEVLAPIYTDSTTETCFGADPAVINPHGTVHGGVLLAMVEFAATRHVSSGSLEVASIQLSYVRPAFGDLRVVLVDKHRGNSLRVIDATVLTASGKPCTFATVIYRRGS